jgi:hypothetical protein
MRLCLATALLATGMALNVGSAMAQESYPTPWCSNTSGIGKECYQNLAQCQQNVQGNGGFCNPTADYKPEQPLGYGPFPQRPNQ